MRRSWAIMSAAAILLLSGAVAVAYPAAAATAGAAARSGRPMGPGGWVSPGGPGDLTAAPQSRMVNGHRQTMVSSSNWSGYAATSTTTQYTSVAASWTQPAGQCSRGNQYSAFWAGLDGYSSPTVEQTGSEADCIGRTAQYSSWYEMYPANPVYFTNTVKPGDHFSASVTYGGSNVFTLVLTDSTENWTHTISATLAGAARSSAEVIAEAPCCTYYGGTLPLTNFGSVNFTSATVNGAGLCKPNPVEIVMPNATPSAINACENFSISYTGRSANPFPFF
jgi:hypothetical protein